MAVMYAKQPRAYVYGPGSTVGVMGEVQRFMYVEAAGGHCRFPLFSMLSLKLFKYVLFVFMHVFKVE